MRAERRAPQVLTGEQVAAILEACVRLRDRFLFALLAGSGLRIGEALGLRHEDVCARRCDVTVRARRNGNRARAKSWGRMVIPAHAAKHLSDLCVTQAMAVIQAVLSAWVDGAAGGSTGQDQWHYGESA